MSLGSDVAAEIAGALAEGSAAVGDGPLFHTLRRPGAGPTTPHDLTPAGSPTDYELTGIDTDVKVRDRSGTLTGETRRTLTVNATGEEPKKSDTIAVGVKMADVDSETVFSEIVEVRRLAPGGVPLLYEVDLAR